MRKSGVKVLLFILLVFVVLAIYTVWDNNRIKVLEQEIVIDDLTEELEGFTILQVTDLHEKEFGKNQEKLIKEINSLRYDAIVFTGDMLVSGLSENYHPYYTLIEGINNKENALYIPGNSDPNNYEMPSEQTFQNHDFIKGMEKRGVNLLESIHSIKVGSANVHFVDFELSIINPKRGFVIRGANANNASFAKHQQNLLNEISFLNPSEDSNALIALNHYPIVDARINTIKNDPLYVFRDYDLIMAGHYHGGQYRLPFIGAFFVPEPYYENSGLFPPKDRVKGLWEYEGTKQYVSAGLGSSKTISFLKFRLFNTPEINVLTLKKASE
ncbi:metallophosphoesterase [Metabacillus herbersteinensis]|uniref:Metallophosphoesterase n=1 Tax=Metabacillus herbersteinensis TaxID=283816 RepID=A0ABV6GAJ2_9BACI